MFDRLSCFIFGLVSCVQATYKKVKDAFRSGRTKDAEFRRDQLRKLSMLVEENEDSIVEALSKDLHKVNIIDHNAAHFGKSFLIAWLKTNYT